jgi:transcriptional regulator GlxA family with amidase domain
MKPKRIALIGFEEVTALHLVGPAEAFTAAALDDGYGGRIPCYDVTIVGIGSECFRAESGMAFTAEMDLAAAQEFDTVIIAGGRGIHEPRVANAIRDWILQHARSMRRIGAICTGVFALAPTGLLDGREVTVHWRFASELARRFPRLRIDHRKPLIRAGSYFTASGLSAGINLSLTMIADDYGPHVAQAVSRELALFPVGPSRAEPVGARSRDNQGSDRFADLVAWIVRNLDSDLSVETLARRACICPSHFSKAFKSVFGESPSDFVENLRLHEARRRLSKRQKTLQSVATSVGFTSSDAFQRAFQKRFGTRPSRLLEPATKRGPIAKVNGSRDTAAAA